jgi:uncharacterized membrane protein
MAKTKHEVLRVGGKLKEIITVHDSKGKVAHHVMQPLMVEFHWKDLFQVVVGASLRAIPAAFTEETSGLGASLPMNNIYGILALSLAFVAVFAFYHYYKEQNRIKHYFDEFLKRTILTYVLSFCVVGLILFLIQQAPWETNALLAFKRTVIVTFPASMSASLADTLK